MSDIRFMDEIRNKGNFWFLENIHKELYENLLDAERVARVDFKTAGILSRNALEAIISNIIREHKLDGKIPPKMKLYEKINALREESIFPRIGQARADYENGNYQTIDYYDFIRGVGNAAAHHERGPWDIKVGFDEVHRSLKGLHLMMKKYYEKRISKDTPNFMVDYMPIDKYFIQEAYIPDDTLRSRCIIEFKAFTQDSKGDKAFHVILRLYNKADLNENFILRNNKTFLEASKLSISSVPEGMTRMREIIPYKDNKSSYYLIAYEFNREPKELTGKLLKDIDFGKRVKICKRIVDSFYNLHMSEVPIYHRMISDEGIYISDFGREWVPYIVKFDFAKIELEGGGTVFDSALNARDRLQALKQIKYLSPEWKSIKDTESADWEKVDIYSLGILLSDILFGNIGTSPVDVERLEDLDVSEELLDLIDNMRADDPRLREDISRAKKVFSEEVIFWS